LARERTALAWTRSALNLAASGTLIARAAFTAHLDVLGLASAVAMASLALLTWRHGRGIYLARGVPGTFPHHERGALGLLTAATLVTATVSMVIILAV
jgi:uncharacterized membrane protein YidH (DUF202 family)